MVDQFCTRLATSGISVLRDVDGLKLGDSLSAFMRQIGQSDFLCIFLSDAYLRSPNCMYELLIAWQKSKDEPADFRRRVKAWVMPGAEGVFKPETRLEYARHWKQERDRLAKLVAEFATDGLAESELQLFRRVKEFAEHVNAMLCHFADTLLPGDGDQFEKWVLESFPAAQGPTDAQLAAVYAETVKEIGSALSGHDAVAAFLAKAAPGLVTRNAESFRLAEAVHRPPFDACQYLGDVERALPQHLPTFNTNLDLEALELVIGGITVLGVDARWTWEQRNLAAAALTYPGLKDTVPVDGETAADFLHILVAALADGHARLRRVFGEVPQAREDLRRVPPPPMILGAIREDERVVELMAYFVDTLGKEKADKSKPQQVKLLFKQLKDRMSMESQKRHNPFHGTGEAYREHSATIRKFLQPQDFWLIFPSGDDSEDKILPQSVWVLMHLHAIFTLIKKRRAQLTPAA